MEPNDRGDLIFDLADLMAEYEKMGYTTEQVQDVVIGYAKGRNSGGQDE